MMTLGKTLCLLGQLLSNKDREHNVIDGDSLAWLAQKYGTTVKALKKLNNLHGDVIYSGRYSLLGWCLCAHFKFSLCPSLISRLQSTRGRCLISPVDMLHVDWCTVDGAWTDQCLSLPIESSMITISGGEFWFLFHILLEMMCSVLKIDGRCAQQAVLGRKANLGERNAMVEGIAGNCPHPLKSVKPLLKACPRSRSIHKSHPIPRLQTVRVEYGDTLADIAYDHG